MSKADQDYLKQYANLNLAREIGLESGSDAPTEAATATAPAGETEAEARARIRFGQGQIRFYQGQEDRTRRDQRAAIAAQEDERDAAIRADAEGRRQQGRGLSSIAGALGRLSNRADGIPTPGGIGGLLLALLTLVSLTVPVGPHGETRFNLLWLTLTGRTKLNSTGVVSGEGTSSGSHSGGTFPSFQQSVIGASAGVKVALGLPGGSANPTNQEAVSRATATAQASQQQNNSARPPSASGPYKLGSATETGAFGSWILH